MEMFCLANDIFFRVDQRRTSLVEVTSDLPLQRETRQDKMPRRTYVGGGGVEPVPFWYLVTVD
jgi:hypothetical protein